MKTYKSQEQILLSNGFTTNNKVTFVEGVPTHEFINGNKKSLVIHLGIGKGYETIEVV